MFKHNHINQNTIMDVILIVIIYVFATLEVCMHSYVSYSQLLESTKNFCLQHSLRYLSTFERVVNA